MIYASLILSLPLLLFTPWWTLAIFGALACLLFGRQSRFKIASGAGFAAIASTLIRDGQSHGLISKRVAEMFGFPQSFWIFLLVGVLVFLTVLAGACLIPSWGPRRKP